jgi:hypothetical protein
MRGLFSAKLGLKISDGPKAAITISVAAESTGDLTNRNELLLFFPRPQTALGPNKQEPTTLILPYESNKHYYMDKEEFHWFCCVMRG